MVDKNDINSLVEFIKTEVTNAGKTGCVVGVSGGIDSSVVVALCKLAFPDTTRGLSMPIHENINGESRKRASELCHHLNIQLKLSLIMCSPASLAEGSAVNKKATGNYHARQRMAELYLEAEITNSLVIGTDNANENFIGYFTKGGDGLSDLEVLGEYYKHEVYELGKLLNLPESCLNAVPTAELWEGQTDEDEIGMTYDRMTKCIELIVSFDLKNYWNSDLIDCFNESITKDITKVLEMHKQTEHKRMMAKCYERPLEGK